MYRDERLVTIAKTVAEYSLKIKKGDKVVINAPYLAKPLVIEMIKQIYKVDAYPFVIYTDAETDRNIYEGATEELIGKMYEWNDQMYKEMDCYINIRAVENDAELANVNKENIAIISRYLGEFSEFLLNNKRWVLLGYPTIGTAQKMRMSLEACSDYMFKACCSNYKDISIRGNKLKQKMKKAKQVRIISPNTNLELNIENCDIEVTDGIYNLPDGETATAPIKYSANGYITINTPSTQNGMIFNNIKLVFENGKVIEAIADNNIEELNKILDIDEGSRYLGEFAFGLNPLATKVIGMPLYDEKIIGSFHIALGKSLPGICDNGNRSNIHWDLIQIQTPEYGGGVIYFDNEIIMKDGELFLD